MEIVYEISTSDVYFGQPICWLYQIKVLIVEGFPAAD